MKVGKWIMTALIVIVAGFVISVIVMSAVLGRRARNTINEAKSKANSAYTEMTADISVEFTDIDIQAAGDMEVRLEASRDDSCQVVYYNSDDVVHAVYVQDGTLRITCTDNRTFGSDLGFGNDPYITVRLPEKRYGSVSMTSSTGTLQSNAQLTCDEFEVRQDKGDIYVTNLTSGYVSVISVSGDVTLATVSTAQLSANGQSGDFSVMNVSAQNMQFSVGSGRLEGYNIAVGSRGSFVTEKGDIFIQGCSGGALAFASCKGDVELSVKSGTELQAYTESGKVSLPEELSSGNGSCTINTESGNITAAYDG